MPVQWEGEAEKVCVAFEHASSQLARRGESVEVDVHPVARAVKALYCNRNSELLRHAAGWGERGQVETGCVERGWVGAGLVDVL